MASIGLDGLVASLEDGVGLVVGVVLVVEAVLAGQDEDEDDKSKRPKNEPNDECDA